MSVFRISKSLQTDKNRPIIYAKIHVGEIIEIVTHVKRASALKCGSKCNRATKDLQLPCMSVCSKLGVSNDISVL